MRRKTVDAAANQLGGTRSDDRVVITLGKFSVADVFDTNQYAHDPRSDFFNWAAIDAGTFDYAADAWGYTVGAAVEWYRNSWTLRAGVFDLSTVPNSAHLDPGFHEFQSLLEIEKRHEIRGRAGRLLLTLFDSRGRMGLLDDAVRARSEHRDCTRHRRRARYRGRGGASLDLEQQLTAELGAFARIGKARGNVETYEFTDIDRTVSAGLALQGTRWHRAARHRRRGGDRQRHISGARTLLERRWTRYSRRRRPAAAPRSRTNPRDVLFAGACGCAFI